MTGRAGVTGRALVGRAGAVLTGAGQAQGARVLGRRSLFARVLGWAGPAGAGRALVTWSEPASKKCSLDFRTDLTEGPVRPVQKNSEQNCSWSGLTGPWSGRSEKPASKIARWSSLTRAGPTPGQACPENQRGKLLAGPT
ncbi:hypothetical protein TIFTF001_052809 [Ficus carica]|uniref:Uncharacterized protein n=1 Tax=Ficus carica TaxID=3494 RepID=A0AA88EJK2_FICCA|nr:hypothetical protein TIFTF001_052809 [Ficus carica]